MKKGQNFLTIILIILILTVVYLLFFSIFPIIMDIIQDNPEIFNFEFNKRATVIEAPSNEIKYISFEDKQRLLKFFPKANINAKVYYNIYGKKVIEDDTVLDFSNVKVDENLAEYLALFPNLKEVNLNNQNLTRNEKIMLKSTYPYINFKWNVEILDENVDGNIETLDLSNKTITDIEDFKQSLKLLTNLKTLDLCNTNLSNEELAKLREEFPNTKINWVIHLGKWSLRTDAVAFSVLVYKYDYKRLTSADIQVLKYCTDLQALDLGHQAIEDISVIGEYLPNLRVLILADNKIKDISPIANLKHLHYLELFMNDITDSSPLASCKELVDLNISFNYKFSDISGILNLPLLERLWLISDRISGESYNLIRKTYPNVKLVTTGSGSTNSGWRTHERYYAMIDMYRKNYISDVFLKYDNK